MENIKLTDILAGISLITSSIIIYWQYLNSKKLLNINNLLQIQKEYQSSRITSSHEAYSAIWKVFCEMQLFLNVELREELKKSRSFDIQFTQLAFYYSKYLSQTIHLSKDQNDLVEQMWNEAIVEEVNRLIKVIVTRKGSLPKNQSIYKNLTDEDIKYIYDEIGNFIQVNEKFLAKIRDQFRPLMQKEVEVGNKSLNANRR